MVDSELENASLDPSTVSEGILVPVVLPLDAGEVGDTAGVTTLGGRRLSTGRNFCQRLKAVRRDGCTCSG